MVCDVGANKGSFLYWLSKWTYGGRVVAFEPQPDLSEYLVRMCSGLGLKNVTIESQAAFSETGQRDLFIPHGHAPGASLRPEGLSYAELRAITVRTVALDDYFSDRDSVSVLKIDVEGAENSVFEGAERILTKDRPLLVFECEARHLGAGRISDVLHRLETIGYRGTFIERGAAIPIAQFREDIHQRRHGEWFWKEAGYCPNFVFSPIR